MTAPVPAWRNATPTQRMAQIQGAIEVGMTATQCAMNLRVSRHTVLGFMRQRGLSYPLAADNKRQGLVANHVRTRRNAERSGQPRIEPVFAVASTDKLFDDHPWDDS